MYICVYMYICMYMYRKMITTKIGLFCAINPSTYTCTYTAIYMYMYIYIYTYVFALTSQNLSVGLSDIFFCIVSL